MYYFTGNKQRVGETCEHPFDAFLHATGPVLHKVGTGKVDATELLREFSRWCALQVIDMWDAPDVVRKYLETGDDSLRVEACEVAGASEVLWSEPAEVAAWPPVWAVSAAHRSSDAASAPWAAGVAGVKAKFKDLVDEAFGD